MIWWEKTIEYLFVQEYIGFNKFVAPLDGDEEKAGDLIFSEDNRWLLIEFKKSLSTISSEEKKFINYASAKRLFQDDSHHHLMIFGSEYENEILLHCKQYFTGESVPIDAAMSKRRVRYNAPLC